MQVDPTLASSPAVASAMLTRAAKRNAPTTAGPNALHLDKRSRAHFLNTLLSAPLDPASHPLLYAQAAIETLEGDSSGPIWWASAPTSASKSPADCEDFTGIHFRPPRSSSNHYRCLVRINHKRVGALVDTGAATSLISRGLCEAIGLPIDPAAGGLSYKSADGGVSSFAGIVSTPTLTLHP